MRFDRHYWDASNDSLRKVLATQRDDTQRLQTLAHLFNLTDLSQESLPGLLLAHREALRLATRLGYPEWVPLRRVVAFDELALAHRQARLIFEIGHFSSVAEVADAVGSASPKYFSNVYAERFGRRPGDYRAPQS